jgi:hypothetical protein
LPKGAREMLDIGGSHGYFPVARITNHRARGGRLPAVIWLLLLAGKRPKEKPLGSWPHGRRSRSRAGRG